MMADPAMARLAAVQLRAGADHMGAALTTLQRGGAPVPVVQHLAAAVADAQNTAHLLEEAGRA